jgi:hypothetical protein
MLIKVRMLAHMDGAIREVSIPDHVPAYAVLDEVFYWGQNDFQAQANMPSVSVGDVIEHEGLNLVRPIGFKKITEQEYQELKALPRRERYLYIAKLWLADAEKVK